MRGLVWRTAHARSIVAAMGVLAVGIGTEATAPARLAAPWAIMVHGSLVERPITLANWHENLRLMLAIPAPGSRTPTSALKGRPYLDLALFWGPEWKHLADSPEAITRLRPEQTNHHGRLYPARGDSPAIVVYDPPSPTDIMLNGVRALVVAHDGLEVLAKHGVPVRVTR